MNYEHDSRAIAPAPQEPGLDDTVQSGHKYLSEADNLILEITNRLRGPRPHSAEPAAEPFMGGGTIGSARTLTSRVASLVGDLGTILQLL